MQIISHAFPLPQSLVSIQLLPMLWLWALCVEVHIFCVIWFLNTNRLLYLVLIQSSSDLFRWGRKTYMLHLWINDTLPYYLSGWVKRLSKVILSIYSLTLHSDLTKCVAPLNVLNFGKYFLDGYACVYNL